jgi:hypothetical protein
MTLMTEADARAATRSLINTIATAARAVTANEADALSLATQVWEKAAERFEKEHTQARALEEKRQQLAYERTLSQHGELLIGAIKLWWRKRWSDPDVRDIHRTTVLLDPPAQFLKLNDVDYRIMVRYAEPSLRAALGDDYSAAGARRAVEQVHDELVAKERGMSLDELLAARHDENLRIKALAESEDDESTLH